MGKTSTFKDPHKELHAGVLKKIVWRKEECGRTREKAVR